ncbi:spermine/spermidine synthase domain-containing protein [Actinomadura rudentiformis]|uniref:Spermidine synthase n=1 Tax=Actinomadura rudentiformis TaxID=359158 RepID=A0A6H9Y9N6_9ACTN|nr:spermidine synthase [Actinomadura rudentiformis]KAB2339444.1 spermidine synthase [Actinomadura rudentiformis]
MTVSGEPATIERAHGRSGELVLRRTGAHTDAHYEIISNGVFLMDTRNGESERLLVRAAVAGLTPPVSLLIGGLGVGFSLAEAVALPGVDAVTVVEIEPAVIGWHATHLRPFSAAALDDPRVHVANTDLLDHLRGPGRRYDAICLDIDNGPDWTVTPANASLYGDDGLALLTARLTGPGVLAVWSAGAAPAFEERLRARFADVEALPVPVPRGEPDIVYLARRPLTSTRP